MLTKEIKKAMIDKDLTLSKLSKITGYSRSHLCKVINGHYESQRVKKILSLALNRDFNED